MKGFPLGRGKNRSTPTKASQSRAGSEETELRNDVGSRIEPGPYGQQVPSPPSQPWATAPGFAHQILNCTSFFSSLGRIEIFENDVFFLRY